MQANDRERFLIVRLAAVGDIVMASTLARRIRDELPSAHVTWLCGKAMAPLVNQFADVDEVLTLDERAVLRGSAAERAIELMRTWRALRRHRFTRVLLLHVDKRYRAVVAPLFATPTVALTSREAHGKMNPVPGRYFGDEYARLLDGHEHRGPIANRYPFARLKPLPRVELNERSADAPHVAIVPGGAHNVMRSSGVRRWPLDHYVTLARALVAEGASVTLIGDANDVWVRPAFAGLTVNDRIGTTTLPETLALLSASNLVISHDTGPMHLARLVGTRLVALFGPTMPSQFVVADDRTTVLWGGEHLPCRPCYDGKEFADCSDNKCMSSIDPAVVIATARGILART